MENFKKYKKRIFDIIQIGNKYDFLSTAFDVVISFLIVLSICVTFLQTFDDLSMYRGLLGRIELVTIIAFVIEYGLRLWTAEYLYDVKKPVLSAFQFMTSFYGIVDLLTIISYFIPFIFTNGFVALRLLRVVRIMRLFKLNSTYDAFNVITAVLIEKKNQIISSVFMIVILMLASSMCMYSLEHDAQPESFRNAFSGIWWSVSTLLTVGYGDIYPVTIGGKIMAIVISFLGVGMVAIPTGIISAGFVEEYTKIKSGSYEQGNADFVNIKITKEHGFAGKKISEIQMIEGLYPAVAIRGDSFLTPYSGLILQEGDNLLLASMANDQIKAKIEEIHLAENHPWIGKQIMQLDISRLIFILMIRRRKKILKPEGSTLLRKDDTIVILDRR